MKQKGSFDIFDLINSNKQCRYSESISESLRMLITKVESLLAAENVEKNAANSKKAVKRIRSVSTDARSVFTEDSKRSKAMAKRHSAIRNTVSCDQNEALNDNDVDDDEQLNSTLKLGKNTNQNMHGKNSLYRTMCHFCKDKVKGSMVQHYRKKHSDREVPIARMSPEMAKVLRMQGNAFQKNDQNKITGLCYFCEENHTFLKFGWQVHLIAHTGEKMFHCTQCRTQIETKKQHDRMPCKNSIENVVQTKENTLVGFMCNDCNYFQFSSDRLIAHLKNQHGFEKPIEPNNFKEFVLVKNV